MNEYEKRGTIVYYTVLGYETSDFISDEMTIYYIGSKKCILDLKYALRKYRPVLFEMDANKNFKNDIHITGVKKASLREFIEEVYGL